jgi:glutamyl-tRNA reductase
LEAELQIKMVGIDHNKASIQYRELFSFTKAESMEAMKQLKETFKIRGCIILSTCNRTELWLSVRAEGEGVMTEMSAYEMLCDVKGINRQQFKELFTAREGEDALWHLMELTCGLDSRVFGEDQIISQVRESLFLSRKCRCTDLVLERVFQTAIGAAKKVKSQVKLSAVDGSAALQAVSLLKEKLGDLKGIPCLIIGNGQMGKLAANALLAQGAEVKMTLRKKMHGQQATESLIPEGCVMIPYENRVQELAAAEVVISATRSPHYTLKKAEVERCLNEKPSIWLDLAVPRDIDPDISILNGITIFDIDHLAEAKNYAGNHHDVEASIKILEEYLRELKQWFAFRQRVPDIKNIIQLSSEDFTKRISHPVNNLDLQETQKNQIKTQMEKAVEKTIQKLLFGLKDTLRESMWQECFEAINRAACKDTLKS